MLALMLLQIIKKPLLYILPFLLLSSLAWAESELSECEGSPTKDNAITQKWTDCQGSETYSDGSQYVGEFRNGQRNGQGTLLYADGTMYSGEWRDGEKWTGMYYDQTKKVISSFFGGIETPL